MNNYRPISNLPYFSKLFEKVMYTRLYDYINKLEILYPDQHGFQPNHSTAMSLLNTYDKISLAFDNNEYALGVFLDLSKAFDRPTVNHKILFKKLELYGIRGIPLLCYSYYILMICPMSHQFFILFYLRMIRMCLLQMAPMINCSKS